MNTLIQSSVFADWLRTLADDIAKAHILRRIVSAELGNFGDCEPVGEGISEIVFIMDRVTAFISSGAVERSMCCCVVAAKPARNETSNAPK